MTEKELVKKIKQLRKVKPRKDWVLATKIRILGETSKFELFPFFKPAYAGLFLVLIFFGMVELAQSALPGEPLYPLKKMTERAQAIFVSETDRPEVQLEFANKRLEELNKIASKNEVKKLVPALKELEANVSEAAKDLVKVKKVESGVVEKTRELAENKAKVEKLLATKIETEELEDAYKVLAEREIKNLENSTLTENQEKVLEEAKEFLEKSDYLSAFIKVIEASQIK